MAGAGPDLKCKVAAIAPKEGSSTLYNLQSDDGKDYVIYVSASKTAPKNGDFIGAYTNDKNPGTYNFWKVIPEEDNKSFSKGSSGGYKKSTFDSSAQRDRLNYEMSLKDPRLARQGFNTSHIGILEIASKYSKDLDELFVNAETIRKWVLKSSEKLISTYDTLIKED